MRRNGVGGHGHDCSNKQKKGTAPGLPTWSPNAVLVWPDAALFVWIVSAMTVTKVVEGCVYIRRRYYGILPRVGGEFEHSALPPISLSRSVL